MDNIGNVKGSIFVHTRGYTIKVHGESVWKEILSHLSEKDREILEGSLTKADWYPVPLLNRLISVYDNMFGNGDFKSIVPIAEYIAEQDLGPVFDIFVNLKSPPFVLSSAPSLWSRYFDTGEVSIETADDDKRYYKIVLKEIADENRVSGQALCTYGNPTWLKSALIMAGAKSVTMSHTDCRYKGASSCALEVWWE
jgi:hypothetical protein